MLLNEGIYSKRFDFWHETKQLVKALLFSYVLLMAYLALSKEITEVSRFVISMIFIYSLILLPITKYLTKKNLYKLSLWQREATIYGDDTFIDKEIFSNTYLGYVESESDHAKTVFVNAQNLSQDKLKEILDNEIRTNHEVVFIPLLKDFELSQSFIYELSNTRTNLVQLKNRLKSPYRIILQTIANYVLAILLLPILLPIIGILAFMIKKESPGPVFFAHNRIGKNGAIVPTLKFRSMYSDAQERLEKLLAENKEIRQEWETNFKLKNDPRVTKIGNILRKTSLDELPQIFNVLKGDMNFVGPRPVIQQELDQYYKDDTEYYLMVKPGITGLWQVSGRSDTDYDFRIATDKWYVTNWSLWLDIVILFKTVKTVLKRDGAY
jgi:undecaprenyl-phosphate galactose phosphotransferase